MAEATSTAGIFRLPSNFPQDLPTPKFKIGDRVQWKPLPTQDFGVTIGFQYIPAPHLKTWGWRYVIWLDEHSPSHHWASIDTAWEPDLELIAAPANS